MIAAWAPAAIPAAIAALLVIAPGLMVVWAGWGLRRVTFVLAIPAISVAVYGLSAVLAPWFGLTWSVLPALALAALIAICAFLIRRLGPRSEPTDPPRAPWTAILALLAAAALLVGQFVLAFGSPESIAQRFDVIVHLNSVQYALDTANASAFNIGDTSDIGFYPNGWHALTALVAQLSGAGVAMAANVTNLVVVALVWPASVMSLAAALFRSRRLALIGAAALSTGFGAFPALFFDWGVLYPNAVGYSMVPAVLALVVRQFATTGWAPRLADALLLAFLTAGMTLAHPNALLAALLFGSILAVSLSVRRSREATQGRPWLWTGGLTITLACALVALWAFARTPAVHSPWPPYQTLPQAVGSGILVSPRGEWPTLVVVVLLVCGLVAAARAPRHLPVILPFAAAVTLYVLVSGTVVDNPLRGWLTNPWYSDPNRLAALLPMTVIPVLLLGLLWLADGMRRREWRYGRIRAKNTRLVDSITGTVAVLVLFSVAGGSGVADGLRGVKSAYTATESSLLSVDELALIDRLPAETEPDALIIGSPRTGVALAYSLGKRQVTEMHIFGSPDEDELFLNAHLSEIEEDPDVCRAVAQTGVDYVLDFGSLDVSGAVDPLGYDGVVDLEQSPRLVLVDSEGQNARLFRIEGC